MKQRHQHVNKVYGRIIFERKRNVCFFLFTVILNLKMKFVRWRIINIVYEDYNILLVNLHVFYEPSDEHMLIAYVRQDPIPGINQIYYSLTSYFIFFRDKVQIFINT